jgi:hypothetical protein
MEHEGTVNRDRSRPKVRQERVIIPKPDAARAGDGQGKQEYVKPPPLLKAAIGRRG